MIKEYKKFKQKLITINWDRTWKEEKEILDQLKFSREKLPSNSIYDSVLQYKSQTYFLKFWQKLFLWVISFFGLCYLIFSNFTFKFREKYNPKKYDIAYFYSDKIFNERKKVEKRLIFIESKAGLLFFNDIKFLFSVLIKINFNFSLLSIATYRIAQVRYALNRYSIDEVWCNMEYSAASGILHEYCRTHNLKLANFMHGEKVLTLRDTFCSFDTLHVWDEHYKILFETMFCNAKIVIDNPWLDETKFRKNNEKSICYILKGIESDDEVVNINKYLLKLKKCGFDIKIKEHPRNNNMSKKIQGFEMVENVINVSDVFPQFQFIMGQYSTVLTQAWFVNYNIIVDDITNPLLFKALKGRNYIFSEDRKHVTYFSSFLKSL